MKATAATGAAAGAAAVAAAEAAAEEAKARSEQQAAVTAATDITKITGGDLHGNVKESSKQLAASKSHQATDKIQ